MQALLIVIAGVCFDVALADKFVVGQECGVKLLPEGLCCCQITGEDNCVSGRRLDAYPLSSRQQPSQGEDDNCFSGRRLDAYPRNSGSKHGITVRGRKVGEPDPLIDDECDQSSSATRSTSSTRSSPRRLKSVDAKKTVKSPQTCNNGPKRIENWCVEQAQCNRSITCQDTKDFRTFGGCDCKPYCALTGSCCPECRIQCKKLARKLNLMAVANSCKSTCVGTPLGGNCSCASSCIGLGKCCSDYEEHCGKKNTRLFEALDKDRDGSIVQNDLNFAVGRMLLGQDGGAGDARRSSADVSASARNDAAGDGSVAAGASASAGSDADGSASAGSSGRRLVADSRWDFYLQTTLSSAIEKAAADGKIIANCVLEITKGIQIGNQAPVREEEGTVDDFLASADAWAKRTISKPELERLCTTTPLDLFVSLSVDQYEFLQRFCALANSKEKDKLTIQRKKTAQIGLCHLGEELTAETCTPVQLALATELVGGNPNAYVIQTMVKLREERNRAAEAAETRDTAGIDPGVGPDQSLEEKAVNFLALQHMKRKSVGNVGKPLQPDSIRSFGELHRLAEKAQAVLNEGLQRIADTDRDRLEVATANVKTPERATEKIAADYECQFRKITDLCRGTIATTRAHSCNMAALVQAFETVSNQFQWRFLKNKWSSPLPSAYADINGLVAVPVQTDTGNVEIICELQMHLQEIQVLKSGRCHDYYEKEQDILRSASNAEEEATLEKSDAVVALRSQAFDAYGGVWDKCFGVDPYKGMNFKDALKHPRG